jgi:predicted esterase
MLRRPALLLSLLFATATATAQDVVIFPDGFTLKGKHGKETSSTAVIDSPLDLTFPCDFISSGPRWVYFSNNAKKNIQLVKGAVKDEKTLEYRRPAVIGQMAPVVPPGSKQTVGPFNADGRRTILYDAGRGPGERIVQVVNILSPKQIYLTSVSHKMRQAYSPNDPNFGPVVVRQLLANHPDLRDGWLPVPDPMKRVKIAEFLLECGWRAEAKAELDLAKKEITWAWPKEAADRADLLSAAIDKAEVDWTLGELELALAAGQYQVAGDYLKTYQPKADKVALDRLTKMKATVETLQPKYEATRRHLRNLIDEITGADKQNAAAAVGGAPIILNVPGKAVPAGVKSVVTGAEAVFAELHPDTLDRIETFTQVADTMARERAAGRVAKSTPEQVLSLAVTGWLMGKNGAKNDTAYAAKVWDTRAMVAAYLNERGFNDRAAVLRKYQQTGTALEPDEIAQIVSLLPPIDAENLARRRGKAIDQKESGAPDTFRITTTQTADETEGVNYFLRLPREYHHGRSYPVVVAIHDPGVEAVRMIGLLAAECERNGYILIAPDWAPPFSGKNFDYMGKDHHIITSAVRDVSRKFNVDQDRVFAFGFGQGANFALDLAMSRPDHFAGVIAMAPAPTPQFYRDYSKNAQKVAIYSVTGEWSPGTDGVRKLYQNWLPYGYYATLVMFKGQGAGWESTEVPTIFEWMAPKRRVRGLNSLRMDGNRFDAWHTCRASDDRFYWIGVSELSAANTLTEKKAERPDITPKSAAFSADIVNGDTVVVKTDRGIKKLTIWLERGMVAWDKEVKFSIDGGTGQLKPTKVKPDLELMLEELFRTGDKKMLFFAKFEFKIG